MARCVGASARVIEYTMAQKIPMASSTSPMLITSRISGTGSGITSPNSPPAATKPAIESVCRRKWNGSLTISASVKPALKKAADQIGICPWLSSSATRLAPMPTDAIWSPGTRQLPHSHAKMKPYAVRKSSPTGSSTPSTLPPDMPTATRSRTATTRR